MLKQIKGVLFTLQLLFILGSEYLIYCILNDYPLFIDRITYRLISINILYVKMFQAFALNNSFIDTTMNNKLLKYTDNAPWDHSDIDEPLLLDIANKYNLTNYYNIKHQFIPMNSGMISLVFKMYQKHTNKIFIVKLKRKHIQQTLDDAIDKLLFIVSLASYFPLIRKYELDKVILKNIDIIRHQTNFLEEVDNMNQMRDNCKHLKYVVIPYADKHVTEQYPDVILMDYIQGQKIHQLNKQDYEGFAKQVIKFGIVTSIVHGVTHGDLHSGNLLFIKDANDAKYPYKIGVLDFGIVYSLQSDYKGLMFDVITQLFDMPPRESAEKLLQSGLLEPPGIMNQIPASDYEQIVSFTEEIIRETIYKSKKANQIQIYTFLSKLKAYFMKPTLAKIGITPSDHFMKSQLVLAMAHGVTLTLCKDKFIPLMDQCLNELFKPQILI